MPGTISPLPFFCNDTLRIPYPAYCKMRDMAEAETVIIILIVISYPENDYDT